jgi:hypothetical protein
LSELSPVAKPALVYLLVDRKASDRRFKMKRNLKTIGLALVAVFALSAVVASAASAQKITTLGQSNVTLTGSGGEQKFVTGSGSEIKCTGVTTTVTGVNNEQAQITATPSYTGCSLTEGGITREVQIDMNGCAYVFTSTGTIVHIECTAPNVIKVTAKIAGAFQECLDIHSQTPTTPNWTATNGTSGANMDFTIVSGVSGITYERTGSCKKAEAQENETNNAVYTGSVTVTCETAAAVMVDCTAS